MAPQKTIYSEGGKNPDKINLMVILMML